jgi:hypothetical protein
VGQKALVSYWDVTTDTPGSSASPDPSDIQKASGPVMSTYRFTWLGFRVMSYKVSSLDHHNTAPCG